MSKRKTLFVVAASGFLAMAAAGAFAQGQQPDRTRTQDQSRQTDVDRAQDRDRMMDRDMDRAQDRDRDMTRDPMRDRDYDRDRLREQDRDRIYGTDLMTEQERIAYHNKLRSMATEQERIAFRLEHHKEMQERAKQRGMTVPAAPGRSQIEQQERDRQREREQIFGYSLMTQEELNQHREKIRLAQTEQERDQVRAEHRKEMQERAREQGVTLPPPK